MPASSAPVRMVTVMNAPMHSTKKKTAAAPNRSPDSYGPVAPGAVTSSAGTCLPAASVPQALSAAAWAALSGLATGPRGTRMP
jgi:hypothetical protein